MVKQYLYVECTGRGDTNNDEINDFDKYVHSRYICIYIYINTANIP